LTLPALYRLAAKRALQDAGLTWKDIEAIVIGNSPELFEGNNHPEKWIAEAVGGYGKPVYRVHTGGTVGGSTAIAGYNVVASGMFKTALAISGNKLGDCAHSAVGLGTCYDPIMGRYNFAAGAISVVAIQSQRYLSKYGYDTRLGARVAVKNRLAALKNPYAHIKVPAEFNIEMAMGAPVISTPLRLSDCCPQSDAACAMIFGDERVAKEQPGPTAWVKAAVSVTEGVFYADRDMCVPIALRRAAEIAYQRAGIRNPLEEIDYIEVYDAFSYQEPIWYEGLKLCDWGQGGRLVEEGVTERNGKLPVNMSGGVLSSNSIGASAMIRKAEAALQVMGKAGERQVPNVRVALGHGWGGAIQFHTLMIFSRDP
jgi:acetyl-CoA C-acetyltransferase